ncbi:18413_t:CDS:10 [Rhizophagus irregularis]|nr:18413_t:CDS:10 [Rhizophagus irregularis]
MDQANEISAFSIIYSARTIKLDDNSSGVPLYPVDTVTFQKSSILTTRLTTNCPQGGGPNSLNLFSLRSLYPNGTIQSSTVFYSDSFSVYNFCPLDRISLFALPDNILFISYLREEAINQVRFMGMTTTLDGTIIEPEVELSDIMSLDIKSISSFPYLSKITIKTNQANSDTESGALLFTITYNNLSINWRKFDWDHIGRRLSNMSEGVITPVVPSSEQYRIVSFQTFGTLDGGFGLAYSIHSIDSQPESTPTSISSHSQVYITFLHESALTWTPPTVIYETLLANANITIKLCTSSIDTSSAGYTCFIIVTWQLQPQLQYFWRIINFLSVGSILSYKELSNYEIRFETNRNVAIIYNDVLPLTHYGFCMIGVRQDNSNLQGSLYNITEGAVVKGDDWGIPQILRAKYDVLNNNTIWTAVPGEDNLGTFWYIISNDIHKNEVNNGDGYENKQISSTVPPINATIPTDTKNIIIKYKNPVILSTGFISVYQSALNSTTINTDLLRQTFSALSPQYVQYVNDTNNTEVENVLLRLNATGTRLFQELTSLERDGFFDNLLLSFSQSIPVPLERLRTSKRYQFEGIRDDLPILIKIQLKATRNKEDMNTEQILNNIDTLVRNKFVTKLNGPRNATSFLDSSYGAKEIVSVWPAYRYEIAGIICAIFVLFVLVFLAHNINPTDPKNGIPSMSLFKFVVIFVDFIMDIIFLFYNGRDVQTLYLPSIILLLAPLSINFFITMFIFLREYYSNPLFANFARENSFSTTILLVLGYIDLVSLELLSSNLANFQKLSAPFDDLADRTIYLGSLAILLVEDLPQLVIQILYLKLVIDYKFVPLLTLITCSLIITTNIIGRSYDCYRSIRDHYSSDSTDDDYQGHSSRGSYLIGVNEIFNKWWDIGRSGVGGNYIEPSGTNFDTQPVTAGPSGNNISWQG